MSSFKYESPDDLGQVSSISGRSSASSSRRPSMEPRDSDWFLNKRASISSTKQSDRKGITPLNPGMEVSLAILTSGLSVAAFHAVKRISDRRNAKRFAAQNHETELRRTESLLVPSSIPEHCIHISEMDANNVLFTELEGSPCDTPPAYSFANTTKPTEKA